MVELHEFLVPAINELAKTEGFADDFTLTTASATNAGDGFMGLLLRITIEGPREIDGELVENSKLAVIVKMPPHSPARREQFKAIPIFEREALFYSKLYPLLVQFQHDRGITEEADGFFAVPKCYKIISDTENGNYAMIMEDLKESGYQMFDKHKAIDLPHVILSLKNLARMHALSFAMRDQQPELFTEIRVLYEKIREQINTKSNDVLKMMLNKGIDRAIAALGPFEDFKVDKLRKLKSEAMETFEFCASYENAEPFGVLMHGDCWNNNMMYSYDEGGEPNNIRLFDFQLVRYGSPVNDLVYYIFTSTHEELRNEHYDSLLQIYHTTLCDFITRLGSDGEKLFAYTDFKEQLQKFGRYGLLMAVMIIQVIVADAKDLPDMDQVAKDMVNKKVDAFDMTVNRETEKLYTKRINGVVRDIIRLGYY